MGFDLFSSRTLMTLGGLRVPAEARLLHLTLTMPCVSLAIGVQVSSGCESGYYHRVSNPLRSRGCRQRGTVGRNAAAGALCRVTAGLEPALAGSLHRYSGRGGTGLICCSVTTVRDHPQYFADGIAAGQQTNGSSV